MFPYSIYTCLFIATRLWFQLVKTSLLNSNEIFLSLQHCILNWRHPALPYIITCPRIYIRKKCTTKFASSNRKLNEVNPQIIVPILTHFLHLFSKEKDLFIAVHHKRRFTCWRVNTLFFMLVNTVNSGLGYLECALM